MISATERDLMAWLDTVSSLDSFIDTFAVAFVVSGIIFRSDPKKSVTFALERRSGFSNSNRFTGVDMHCCVGQTFFDFRKFFCRIWTDRFHEFQKMISISIDHIHAQLRINMMR